MKFIPDENQKRMIKHLTSKGKRKALYVSMGLGKTAATLDAICSVIADTGGAALVVAPLNVCLLTWPGEIELWDRFRWLKVANLRTREGQIAWQTGSANIYLINWDSLPAFIRKVLAYHRKGDYCPANIVVYDELSKAKSHASKRVNQWRRFTYLFDYHWGLTGTPNPNSYQDLFAQFRLLCGPGSPLGTAFGKFQKEYFAPIDWNQYKWQLKPGAKERIEELIRPHVLSLGSGEFPIETIDWTVPLDKPAKAAYDELEEKLLLELPDDKEISAANAAVLVQKLLQMTCGCAYDSDRLPIPIHNAKLDALRQIRKAHPKESIIVVTMFKHERARLLEEFPEAVEFRKELLPKWNAGKIRMLVIDPRSAGHGLNMQGPSHIMAWTTLTYSREYYEQTIHRLARKGQKHTVLVYHLMCPGTVDWAVRAVLESKGNQQKGLLSALNNIKKLHS